MLLYPRRKYHHQFTFSFNKAISSSTRINRRCAALSTVLRPCYFSMLLLLLLLLRLLGWFPSKQLILRLFWLSFRIHTTRDIIITARRTAASRHLLLLLYHQCRRRRCGRVVVCADRSARSCGGSSSGSIGASTQEFLAHAHCYYFCRARTLQHTTSLYRRSLIE